MPIWGRARGCQHQAWCCPPWQQFAGNQGHQDHKNHALLIETHWNFMTSTFDMTEIPWQKCLFYDGADFILIQSIWNILAYNKNENCLLLRLLLLLFGGDGVTSNICTALFCILFISIFNSLFIRCDLVNIYCFKPPGIWNNTRLMNPHIMQSL